VKVGLEFRFCPKCGAGGEIEAEGIRRGPAFLDGKRWLCPACGFELYHNVATAAGLILDGPGGIVFLERAKEPGAGKLGLPGGFVDPGESAEDALHRECLEEIGWAPPELSYLGSFPNAYPYRGLVYRTCDLFFHYRLPEGAALPELSLRDGEARTVRILPLAGIRAEDLAFPSAVRALEAYAALPGR
jgi:ADP-ribose pyrophosphatase YjhB (NUDIX family)